MADLHDRTCTITNCSEPIRAKSLCQLHYQRHLSGVAMDARVRISRDGPCLVDGCGLPRRSRGLCAPHYDRGRRRAICPACKGDMKNTSGICAACHRAAVAEQTPKEKDCRQCERTLPVGSFGLRKSGEGAAKWRSVCRECEATNRRMRPKQAYRDRTREQLARPYQSLRTYAKELGIPWAEVVERYPDDNRCELCRRTPEEANPSGRYSRLSLDHCHETGKLRGFLCNPCNTGLGHLGDTEERVVAALDYLRSRLSSPAP